MTDFQKGDRVRVTYETTVQGVNSDGRVQVDHPAPRLDSVLRSNAMVNLEHLELIARKWDGDQPVGTVRRILNKPEAPRNHIGKAIVRVATQFDGHEAWVLLNDAIRGERLNGWSGRKGSFSWMATATEVIGNVPGYPAPADPAPVKLRAFDDKDHSETHAWYEVRRNEFFWARSRDYVEDQTDTGYTLSDIQRLHGPLTPRDD